MSCLFKKAQRSKKFPGKSNDVYTGRDEQKDMLLAGTSEDFSMWVEFKLQRIGDRPFMLQ